MGIFDTKRLRVANPLSEEARRARKILLAVSSVGIVIVRTGLIPTQFSALGIEFTADNQNALLAVLAIVVGYLVVAFLIYAVADAVGWWLRRVQAQYDDEMEGIGQARQELLALERRERDLLRSDSNFLRYARYGLSLLSDLPRYYREADATVRQKLIGSIYDGKLVFDAGSYRTAILNNSIALLAGKQTDSEPETSGFTAAVNAQSYLVPR